MGKVELVCFGSKIAFVNICIIYLYYIVELGQFLFFFGIVLPAIPSVICMLFF